MIIVYGFFLSLLASVYAEDPLLEMKYMDELPETCRDNITARTSRGEDFFRHMVICFTEMIILKIRHPDFIFMADIPDTPVSDAECDFSKIREIERNGRSSRMMACISRGFIGEDPETLSNNAIRMLIKKNSKKLYGTTRQSYYKLNCSNEEFQNIDLDEYRNKVLEENECIVIEILKHMAFMEPLHDEENDTHGEDSDELTDTDDKQTVTDNSDVMKVIKEQMKGILKLIKSSTGRDISDDGNIIIAYTNVFEIKPSKK